VWPWRAGLCPRQHALTLCSLLCALLPFTMCVFNLFFTLYFSLRYCFRVNPYFVYFVRFFTLYVSLLSAFRCGLAAASSAPGSTRALSFYYLVRSSPLQFLSSTFFSFYSYVLCTFLNVVLFFTLYVSLLLTFRCGLAAASSAPGSTRASLRGVPEGVNGVGEDIFDGKLTL